MTTDLRRTTRDTHCRIGVVTPDDTPEPITGTVAITIDVADLLGLDPDPDPESEED